MPRLSPAECLENERLVPRGSTPADYAGWLRLFNGWEDSDRADLLAFVEFMGWAVDFEQLRASKGGLRGALVPSTRVEFRIVIDPYPSLSTEPYEKLWKDSVVRQTVAHEIGHTVFYTRDKPPRRLHSYRPSEEFFCDQFAACLLIPPAVAARAVKSHMMNESSQFYGCTIDLLKMSAELNN